MRQRPLHSLHPHQQAHSPLHKRSPRLMTPRNVQPRPLLIIERDLKPMP